MKVWPESWVELFERLGLGRPHGPLHHRIARKIAAWESRTGQQLSLQDREDLRDTALLKLGQITIRNAGRWWQEGRALHNHQHPGGWFGKLNANLHVVHRLADQLYAGSAEQLAESVDLYGYAAKAERVGITLDELLHYSDRLIQHGGEILPGLEEQMKALSAAGVLLAEKVAGTQRPAVEIPARVDAAIRALVSRVLRLAKGATANQQRSALENIEAITVVLDVESAARQSGRRIRRVRTQLARAVGQLHAALNHRLALQRSR